MEWCLPKLLVIAFYTEQICSFTVYSTIWPLFGLISQWRASSHLQWQPGPEATKSQVQLLSPYVIFIFIMCVPILKSVSSPCASAHPWPPTEPEFTAHDPIQETKQNKNINPILKILSLPLNLLAQCLQKPFTSLQIISFSILQEEAVTPLGIWKGKWSFYHPAVPAMG